MSSIKNYFCYNSEKTLKITSIFKPIYIVLSIFGLFPYSIKFQKHKRILTVIPKSIYLNSVCAISFILFMCSFLALHAQNIFHSISDTAMTKEIMTQMNYILELVNLTIFCLVAYYCAFQNRSTYVKIVNLIANMIEPTNGNINRALKRCRFEINVVIIGFLVAVLILQLVVNFSRNSTLWKMLLVTVTFILPQMIQFTVLAFFYVLILMLVLLLMSIKERISTLINTNSSIMDCFIQSETRLLTIKHGESLYVKAIELKKDINEAFKAPILITTLQTFHSIVSEVHIIYHGAGVENSMDIHSIINCSIWVGYQFAKIYVLARSGDLIKLEILRIGQTLYSIPTEKCDLKLLMEIQHFSTLMSYQDEQLTAYGYFTLDASLITKVIASAVMYIIILVQFDKKI